MVAGDFMEVYSKKKQFNSWHCIASCFFLDTAHNIMQYLEIISKMLIKGGYLINIGPLLYHFEDMTNDPSVELTHEQLIKTLPAFGFKLIKQKKNIKTSYTCNPHSMLQMHYNCVFWIAQKVGDCSFEDEDKDKDNDDDDQMLNDPQTPKTPPQSDSSQNHQNSKPPQTQNQQMDTTG